MEIGLGFLAEEVIDENTRMIPFLRMKNPRKVYRDIPRIGKIFGKFAGRKNKFYVCVFRYIF